MKPSALILGASSGIGLEIARLLSRRGHRQGIAARRLDRLEEFAAAHPNIVQTQALDLAAEDAVARFQELASALAPVDSVYLTAGVGFVNPALDWAPEAETIQTNVVGFARICGAAMQLFESQGHGHLIGLSSVAALRGAGEAPAYGASKAFVSRYLQALRFRARKSGQPILVTDARPGFVDTAMMKADQPFWVATPKKAARQIVRAAENRRAVTYIIRRWALIGWLLKHLPE